MELHVCRPMVHEHNIPPGLSRISTREWNYYTALPRQKEPTDIFVKNKLHVRWDSGHHITYIKHKINFQIFLITQ